MSQRIALAIALATLCLAAPAVAEPIDPADGVDGDEIQLHEMLEDPQGFTSDDGELLVFVSDDSGMEAVLVRPSKTRAYRYRLATGDTIGFAPRDEGLEALSTQVKGKTWTPTSPVLNDDRRHLGAGGEIGPQADYEDGRFYWVGPGGTAAGELDLPIDDDDWLAVWQVPKDGGLLLVHTGPGYDPAKSGSDLDDSHIMAFTAYVPEPTKNQGARDADKLACADGALCPESGLTAALLEEACAGTASELHAFEAYLAWRAGDLEKYDITALVNIAAAIEGYAFKNAKVKAFFYADGDPAKGAAAHLPEACRTAVASGRKRTDREADTASAFVRLRALRKLK